MGVIAATAPALGRAQLTPATSQRGLGSSDLPQAALQAGKELGGAWVSVGRPLPDLPLPASSEAHLDWVWGPGSLEPENADPFHSKRLQKGGAAISVGSGGPGWTCGPWRGTQGSVGLGWPWEGWASVCEGEEGLGVSCPALGRWPHPACPFQWVLAFELFIPLVLFFILLGLRQKKPTISVKEVSFYTAAPLTSAGIVPVMQSLCPDGQRDEFGFLQYANST
ncbi:uncharacterized protein LOC120859778, partial [Oryx dammah]|uniref:uncharacterized protein LOC120859778 n=1 Tax=Oryx dammah TaxID=59534 RepID=UPI001A9BCCD1